MTSHYGPGMDKSSRRLSRYAEASDRVSVPLDLLNQKSIGFDIVLRTTTLPNFKPFRSGVFIS